MATISHSIKLSVVLTVLAVASAGAVPQVWNNASEVGTFNNFSGVWDVSSENWSATPADNYTAPSSTGSQVVWKPESTAWFGGNGKIPANPAGVFTAEIHGALTADGIRQVGKGSGDYTIEGGSLTVTGPNGIRTDRGILTINCALVTRPTLTLYLMATDKDSVLIVGGDNRGVTSGNVCLNGQPGIVRLTNAAALGRGDGSLQLMSNADTGEADTLDINGLNVAQHRTLDNPHAGSGTARLVNDNTKIAASFLDHIHLRSNTSLAFGGTGLGLTLSGTIDGDGALVTYGATTVILSNANTYSGGTKIVSGTTLLLASTKKNSTGPSGISIDKSAALASGAGKTSIAGLVTTEDPSSAIAPGATTADKSGTAGQLSFVGGLDLTKGATIYFDLGTDHSNSDLLRIVSGSTLAVSQTPDSITFQFAKKGALAKSYVLIDYTDASAPTMNLSAFSAKGVNGSFRLNEKKLEFVPTP